MPSAALRRGEQVQQLRRAVGRRPRPAEGRPHRRAGARGNRARRSHHRRAARRATARSRRRTAASSPRAPSASARSRRPARKCCACCGRTASNGAPRFPRRSSRASRSGQAATVTAVDGTTLKGNVRAVAPTVQTNNRTGLVYVDIVGEGARPGMFARGADRGRQGPGAAAAGRQRRDAGRLQLRVRAQGQQLGRTPPRAAGRRARRRHGDLRRRGRRRCHRGQGRRLPQGWRHRARSATPPRGAPRGTP